jgi:hypothetical protein
MQHDDHIWMMMTGKPWAIRSISRGGETITLHLWRGHAPDLEYSAIELYDDWEVYCERAVAMLNERWPRKVG